ncbi:hypothetical protein HAX54_026965 [Datura stramonium]|uniref:NB-ARC domain-containing protein n=1 Tax=Datura stramonium TaxID=4076 RepID=A0ABS8V4A8_DATST|nr:hypothetical protein [Datura stramonium]
MICFKVPDSSLIGFSKTNGLGFLNCFLGKLEELLHSKLDLITELKHQIISVKEELICLRSFLNHFPKNNGEHDEVYGLVTSVTEMAYKAEYVIDSCLSFSHPLWYKVHWVSEVVENIKLVNKDVSDTFRRKQIEVSVHEVAKTSINLEPSLLSNTPTENEDMVLFQYVMEKIKKQLLGGSSKLDVISIVGMAGLGKTTLAEQIYNDRIVAGYFNVRGKCHVTRAYSWRELLLTILNDVEPSDHTKKKDDQLANELRQVLLTKRSLILLDDVWDTKVWDYLHMCFQGVKNGSRIILTTQLSEVAHYASESNPHDLPLLRDDESWKLLQKKVFHGDSCPPELRGVGFRIARSCGGLPLLIVLVAGVLKDQKEADVWNEVEESLYSLNIGSLEESMSIIGFSYMNLPHHLKPCFLYFGGFLRGKSIHVSKLTRLWLAEGFILESKEKGLEDAAQDFLKNLISRNLVMSMEKRFNGKLKTCRVHDLLHKFCLEKAKQENFLLRIYRENDTDAHIYPDKPEEYRLSIHSCRDEFAEWRPHRSSIRSLLFNTTSDDQYTKMARDISFILNSFKLVKVLDLESINIGYTFPTEIESLIHMKYFAARTGADSIPSSIDNLWNLETFIIKGMRGQLPVECLQGFNFPSGLRELTLSNLFLPWSEISIIGTLRNLEVLKLQNKAAEGVQWNVNDTEFRELKYLLLDNLDFAQWSVSEDSFPSLERLVLTNCNKLDKIPSHFEDAMSLKSIEVNWCSWSVVNSAQEILTMQHENMGKDAFTVTIE